MPSADRSATEVRLAVPNDVAAQTEWRAGPYTVSIIVSSDGKTHVANALPLLLAPGITNISPPNTISRDASGDVTLTLTVSPRVLPTQTATLLFTDREIAAQSRTADTQGDRLDNITARYLGDPEQFWLICDANNTMRPDDLTSESEIGRRLPIPLPQGG